MILRPYLDDSVDSKELRRLLTQAGYSITIPADVSMVGARDADHFAYARQSGLTLITKNPDDFLVLHSQFPGHAGLLLVYRDNDARRDMTHNEIVRAIGTLVMAGVPIVGQAHALNHWRY